MRSAPRWLAVTALAVVAALGAPAAASASVGSVPPEVRAYVTGGGLAADLAADELDGAEPGPIWRVFRWTDARLAGDTAGRPTRMANEWAVPVTASGDPVGVAIVSIDLDTELPGLVELVPDAAAAAALAVVPDAAELVRDTGSGAWFALEGDTATPLAAGSSGVAGPTPVDALVLVDPAASSEPGAEPAPAPDATDALGLALALLAVLGTSVLTLALIARETRREL